MSNKNISFIISALMAIGLFVSACSQTPAQTEQPAVDLAKLPKNAAGFTDISVEQLAQTLPEKDYTLVNVHIPYAGDLPQTDLSIPFNEIANYQDQLPAKDAPIVLYCRSGNMSTQAAQTLVGLGYTNVIEVDGGMAAWQSAGYQLVDK